MRIVRIGYALRHNCIRSFDHPEYHIQSALNLAVLPLDHMEKLLEPVAGLRSEYLNIVIDHSVILKITFKSNSWQCCHDVEKLLELWPLQSLCKATVLDHSVILNITIILQKIRPAILPLDHMVKSELVAVSKWPL